MPEMEVKSPQQDHTPYAGDSARRSQERYLKGLPLFALLICLYKALLDISYAYIDDIFGYQGLFLNNKTGLSDTISWILLFVGIPFFKKVFDERTISANVLSILVLFSVIPTISVISFRSDYDISYISLQVMYWSILFLSWSLIRPINVRILSRIESDYFHYATLAVLSISVLVYSYMNTGLRLHYNLIEVYDIRAEARTFDAPFPLNYLVSLADNLLPFFAIYALYRRKFAILLLTSIVIYINFSIAGTKQIVFTIILGIAGYYFIKDFSRSTRLAFAAIALIIFSMAQSLILHEDTLNTLFAYRVLFIPSELHFSYYSYFQMNELLYFNQSILKWMNIGPDPENIQFLLGEYSIGNYSARANNGLFSDAYMNLGILGVIIFPPFIATYLRILDGAVYGLSQRIFFVVTVYVSFVLLGMTFTSALLTSGLIFLVFLLYSMPRKPH